MGNSAAAITANSGEKDASEEETKTFVTYLNETIEHDPVVNALNPLRKIDWLLERYVKRLLETQTKQHDHDYEGEKVEKGKQDENYELFYHITRGNSSRVKVIVNELKEREYGGADQAKAAPPCHLDCDCTVCRKIDRRDAVGATAIHVAYLYREWKIGRFLVENFPAIASKPYEEGQWVDESAPKSDSGRLHKGQGDPGLFTGENILHIAIIHRNYDEVRWLLEFYFKNGYKPGFKSYLRRLLVQVTTGVFFHEERSFNFGGLPLLFAVCSNRIEIFDIVLYYLGKFGEAEEPHESDGNKCTVTLGPRAVFCWDRNGNNALHYAVLYKLDDMYMHVLKTAKHVVRKELKDAFRNMRPGEKKFEVSLNVFWSDIRTTFHTAEIEQRQTTNVGGRKPSLRAREENQKWKRGNFNRWLDKYTKKVVRQRMGTALNRDLHSPLTLVASRSLPEREGAERDEEEAEKVRFLTFLLRELKDGRWSYGPMESSVLELTGVLYPHDRPETHREQERVVNSGTDPRRVRMRSAINWLARTNTATAFLLPEIRMIVNTLWEAWGYSLFFWDFLLHIVLTLLLTLLTCLINEQRAFFPNISNDWALTIVIPATGALTLYICLSDCWDLITFVRYRRSVSIFAAERKGYEWVNNVSWWGFGRLQFRLVYNVSGFFMNVYNAPGVVGHYLLAGAHGAVRFNKVCRIIIVIGFALFVFFRFAPVLGSTYGPPQSKYITDEARPGNMYYDEYLGVSVNFTPVNDISVKLPLVVIVIAAWCNFYFFLMGFDYSGPFILTIVRVCYRDVPYFLAFYLIVVVAFASAIAMLVNFGDPDINYGFERLLYTFWTLLRDTVALQYFGIMELDYSLGIDQHYVPAELKWLYQVLAFLFQAIVALLMLNLLIAMLNNTFTAYHGNKEQYLIMEKYNIIKHYESKIEATVAEQRMRDNFTKHSGHKTEQLYEIINDNKEWWKNDQKPTRRRKIALLIICPQNDFMDEPAGSLPVPGASADARRIARMLKVEKSKEEKKKDGPDGKSKGGKRELYGHHIHEVCVAMDAHLKGNISLASSWERKGVNVVRDNGAKDNSAVDKTVKDDEGDGLNYCTVTRRKLEQIQPKADCGYGPHWARHYVEALEMADRFQLTLWPDHCLVEKDKVTGKYLGVKNEKGKEKGKVGYNVVGIVQTALDAWDKRKEEQYRQSHRKDKKVEKKPPTKVTYVNIGLSRKTESYSAIQPEVALTWPRAASEPPGEEDIWSKQPEYWKEPEDEMESDILESMYRWKYDGYDVLVCGEALSHCVFNTVRDMCDIIKIDPSKIHVLRDGTSCIPPPEGHSKKHMLQELQEMGVQVTSIKSFFRHVIGVTRGVVEDADDEEGRFESSDEEDDDEEGDMEGNFRPNKWPLPEEQKQLEEVQKKLDEAEKKLRAMSPAKEGVDHVAQAASVQTPSGSEVLAGGGAAQAEVPAHQPVQPAHQPATQSTAHPASQPAPSNTFVDPGSASVPAASPPGPAVGPQPARIHRRKQVPVTYQLAPLAGPLYTPPVWTPTGTARSVGGGGGGGGEIYLYHQPQLLQEEQETKEGLRFVPTASQPPAYGGGRQVHPS